MWQLESRTSLTDQSAGVNQANSADICKKRLPVNEGEETFLKLGRLFCEFKRRKNLKAQLSFPGSIFLHGVKVLHVIPK